MQDSSNSQFNKAGIFKALHEMPGAFVIPNPWDAGSAKLLTGLGFEALATTSAGLAYMLGKTDGTGTVTRDEALENAGNIVSATHLPVSADLENGYGDRPEDCAETILLAAQTGLVGGSIEDATGRADEPIYDFDHAVARIKAAVAAARTLSFHFTLTARAENYLHGHTDLEDTIRRLTAYADAGADVLFAPGIKTRAELEAVVKAVAPRPVNVLWGFPGSGLGVDDLGQMGVKRISVGSSLARAAYGSFYQAAKEIREQGSFGYANDVISYADMKTMFGS